MLYSPLELHIYFDIGRDVEGASLEDKQKYEKMAKEDKIWHMVYDVWSSEVAPPREQGHCHNES